MTAKITPADTAPTTSAAPVAHEAAVPAPPSWAWMRGALILAGAAQLITISALVSADPLTATWYSLLLAIAPALLVAAAAFAPAPANLPVAVVAAVVLAVGIIAGIAHTGAFYLPALVVLAVAIARIWRARLSPDLFGGRHAPARRSVSGDV
jgi:hypothetical protein